MEIGVLIEAGGIARVRAVIVRALQVSIVTLGAGERRSTRGGRSGWGDTGLAAVRAVIRVRRWPVGVLTVVAGAQLLCFYVKAVLANLTVGGRSRRHGTLSAPGWNTTAIRGSVRAAGDWNRRPMTVVCGWGRGAWHVAVKREVLVELVNIKGLHVADDIGAQLVDVHITEVNVLPAAVGKAAPFVLQILLNSVVEVCFRGGGWCRWSMRLPWKEKSQQKVNISWNTN